MASTRGLTIGNVARRAGLRPSAIRYYEAAGLLPEPMRVSGWRRYGEAVFTRLAVIDLAKQAGFSLDDIRTLLRESSPRATPSERWVDLARTRLRSVEALITGARAMKDLLIQGIECRCTRIEACPHVLRRVGAMAGDATALPPIRRHEPRRRPV